MALDDTTVLDLTRLLPGPFCTQVLADFGATVIKVEDPRGGDPLRIRGHKVNTESGAFMALNRNKKSLALDLKHPEGRSVFRRLSAKADVIVEGFRPGVVGRLGIDYESVKNVNEGIIYCSISGYGQEGPWRDRPGHDLNYIGIGGLLSLTGTTQAPPVIPGGQTADVYSGLWAAIGILIALREKEKSGKGVHIDLSMLETVIASLPLALGEFTATGKEPRRGAMVLNGGYACYQVYKTRDGGFMSLGALEPHFWEEFCRVIGREDLVADHYAPEERQQEMIGSLAAVFAGKTRDEWTALFHDRNVPCEPVLSFPEMLAHPQVRSRAFVTEVDHPTEGRVPFFGCPLKNLEAGKPRSLPPRLGEHTAQVLGSAGFSAEEIAALQEDGVVGGE